MGKPNLRLVEPSGEKRTVTPRRSKNAELRQREYLTAQEVEKLIKTARAEGRYGHRDATLILMAYRHGLRAAEIASLQWDQVEFSRSPTLHVVRKKRGKPGAHPLSGDELRALRELRRQTKGPHVFETERGGPFTPDAVNKLIKRHGKQAGFGFPVHAHMLRHGCGYALANRGVDTRTLQDYLGHRDIRHTVRYTELAPTRFRGLWDQP